MYTQALGRLIKVQSEPNAKGNTEKAAFNIQKYLQYNPRKGF